MQINVNVEDIESVDLTTPIETRYRYDDDGEREEYQVTIGHLIATKVTAQLSKDDSWGGLKKKFLEIRDEEIRAAVRPLVDEALNGAIQKTNNYGEPTSGTTTMRELIMAEVSKVINERSDRYRTDSPTMLQATITKAVRTELGKELQAVFDAEKQKVVDAVRASAADLIAEAVKKGLGR